VNHTFNQIQQIGDAIASSQVTGWDVLAAVAILALAYPVGIVVRRLGVRMLKRIPNLPADISRDSGRLLRWLVYLIALAWALSIVGVSVGWVAVVVAVVLVVGVLMVKPMIENSAAGLLLTLRPVYAVGDQIDTVGYEGTVTKIGSRTTVLKTTDGRDIHIPNTEVLKQPIVVFTAAVSRKAEFDITVAFDTDLDSVTTLLADAISGVEDVVKDPAPTVQASGFDHTAITLTIGYWYPSAMSSGSSATDGVIRAVKKALSGAGIQPAPPTVGIDQNPGATSSGKSMDISSPD
jgi:small-conductance mechanosensitive channel